MDEPTVINTWILKYGLYRCGNCDRIADCVDIAERSHCFHCGRVIKWYEDKDGTVKPVKYSHSKYDEVPLDMRYTY